MQDKKVQFSPDELRIIQSSQLLLTKQSATRKIGQLLELTRLEIDRFINSADLPWHQVVNWQGPKISRGENYKGLPYQVLDHPRYFHRKDILAFRVLCWWGHYFCHSLHISGRFLEVNKTRYMEKVKQLKAEELYIGINSNPWNYEINKENYTEINDLTHHDITDIIDRTGHLKISSPFSLEKWHDLPVTTVERFRLFSRIMA